MEKKPRRILFYYNNFCGSKSHGGTEVATLRISRALKETGEWEVFHSYGRGDGETEDSPYKATIKYNSIIKDLPGFIRDHEIDIVVNMGRFFRHNQLKEAIKKSGREVKLMLMHHFAPGSEKKKATFSASLHLLKLDPTNFRYWMRFLFYPLARMPRNLSWPGIYKKVYEDSDGIILLSPGYKDKYKKIAKIPDDKKFHAIPNIYEKPRIPDNMVKEKRVLVLSRMEELQKRISLVLKIWKKIEERGDLDDWSLDIVGHGQDIKALQKMAGKMNFKRLKFHGWQKSTPYLERSSILMMTSLFEGLSLSMIEAQAFGVVPIAFNSYASLKDVVEDGESGIIVDNFGDIETYAQKLAALMKNEPERERLSSNCMKKADKFSPENIVKKWVTVLNSI